VGQQEHLFLGPDETEWTTGISEGVLAFLGDEQALEALSTGRTREALRIFETRRLAVLFEELQPVAVVVDVEPARDVEFLHVFETGALVFIPRGSISLLEAASRKVEVRQRR
jgi:hypothetical protein